MSRRDPHLRAAGLILRHLVKPPSTSCRANQAVLHLIQMQHVLERTFRQLQKAQSRGWHAAAAINRSQLVIEACHVESAVTDLLRCQPSGSSGPRSPSLSDVHAELRQLEQEFEAVELRLQDRVIAVQTAPIILKNVELGPFSIELHLKRLSHPDNTCFDCVALAPNPADSNPVVTHPHVSERSLCAGDASVPLAAALQEGRIADAFCLVNAVLHEYNSYSAFVSLDKWEGVHCEDCDSLTNPDDLCSCQGCGRQCCDECNRTCDGCQDVFCNDCLERDDEDYFCSNCRQTCPTCDRTVGSSNCDEATGLCPSCLIAQQDELTPDDLLEEPNEQAERQAPPPPVAAVE